MNNFVKRTLTGALFVTVLAGSILVSYITFALLFFIITLLGLNEFYRLVENEHIKPQRFMGMFAGGIIFLSFALISRSFYNTNILLINIPILFSIFIIEIYRKSEQPFTNIAVTLLGVLYIALPFALWNFMAVRKELLNAGQVGHVAYYPEIVLGFLFILWTNDTGAYLSGMSMGKHKLFERISPKKSWEGAIGGGILSLVIAYVIAKYFTQLSLQDWLIIAIITSIIGPLGDLTESAFKRSIGVKDSGNILPGHGGILDRFDAFILATPFVFTYLTLFHH